MSADLAAEHTASSQAAELLDGETGQRLKLQKELGEIQVCGFYAICNNYIGFE